jgi:teichuronic acid biosynthesis glycosyltransferase TuaH
VKPAATSAGIADQAWDGLIVICAANRYDGIKLADQHMAECLAQFAPVLYVDPPVSRLTPIRNSEVARSLDGPRIRLIRPNLARFTPVVQPGPSRPGLSAMTTALLRRHLGVAVSALRAETALAVVSAWPQYPVFGSCREEVRIYWAQDDFVGGAALLGIRASHVESAEGRIARAAHAVVAANPLVAGRWRDRGLDVALIPFGVDTLAYATVDSVDLAEDAALNRPVAGFIGHINERIDLDCLVAIASRGRSLLMVGPVNAAFDRTGFDALRQRPNVCCVGPKPFAELPRYMRMIDVGLVPYRDSAFNRSSFPLKTLEYLAAGRPVVSADLPATRWLATEMIEIASEPDSFADSVDRLLNTPPTAEAAARRRDFAARHSWMSRAEQLYSLVHERRT